MSASKQSRRGFTIVELLIVIGITLLFIAAGSSLYSHLLVSTQLNEAVTQIAQNLRLAQIQSVTGLRQTAHGVKFEPHRYTLYQGSSYDGRDIAYDRVTDAGNAITLTTTLTNDDVNFSTGLGLPNLPNSNGIITVTHTVNGALSVTINSLGVITE